MLPIGWFQVGCEEDVPPDACYVSSICGTWVWVTADGIDGLSQFTLAIIDMATTDLALPTKSIVRNYDAEGNLQSTEVTTQETDRESREGPRKVRPSDRQQASSESVLDQADISLGSPRTPRDTAMASKRGRRRVGLSASPLPNLK